MMANWTSIKKRIRPWRMAVLLGAGGSLCVWASSIDFAAPPALPQHPSASVSAALEHDRVLQLLRNALRSTERTFFSGEQTILTFDEGDGSACVTQETHLGSNRYRIAYQNPPDARGRIQIADAGWFQHYLPQTQTLVKRHLTSVALTEANITSRLQHIRQNYLLTLMAQTDNLDGRAAYLLDITPRAKDRPHQKLWIDTQTSLVLRRETYSPTGNQTSETFWRDLNFYPSPPATALNWTAPEGTRTEIEDDDAILSLPEARANAKDWAVVPEKLGESFYFESARLVDARGTQGLYCTYSDGLCTLSLVQLAGSHSFHTTNGMVKPLPIASYSPESAQVTSRGSVNILTWSSTNRQATLSLLGELTEDALLRLAQSLP